MANVPQAGPLATFSVAGGPRFGEQLPVPKPVVVIGRAAGCDVVIDDDSVSAQHARLEFDLGAWRITDLESINGTAVEGVKLAANVPTPLPYGTTVRFGGVKVQFRQVAEADPSAARAAYTPPPPPTTLKEERSGFRFPLWLVVLLLLLVAVVAYVVVDMVNNPVPAEQPSAVPVQQAEPIPAPVPQPAPAPAPVPPPAGENPPGPAPEMPPVAVPPPPAGEAPVPAGQGAP